MEITTDVGLDTLDYLEEISHLEGGKLEVVAAKVLNFGAKIYLSSLKKDDDGEENSIDNIIDALREIMIVGIQNSEMLSEILAMVFDKERSKLGVYDVDSAIKFSERVARKAVKKGAL